MRNSILPETTMFLLGREATLPLPTIPPPIEHQGICSFLATMLN